MALVLADRVRETTTTTGTGTVTLLGAFIGFQSFAVIGNGNTTYYTIADQGGTNWEVGIGTYTSSGTTLARTTVLASSNAGSLVNFPAGTKDVFVTYPAEKSVNQDANGVVSVPVLLASSTTSTTPNLTFNASNSGLSAGAAVSGSYLQTVIQNTSATAGASTNYVLSNNLGTDSTYYGEFGMNASTYSSGTPADFFSINNGVYFSSHDGDVTIGSGNGFKTYLAWGTAGQSAHVVNATGAIGLNTSITGSTNFGTSGQLMQSAGSTATPIWSSALTGLTIDNSVIGGSTAAAGTFTTLIGGGGSANYEQITGGATGKAVQFQSLGSDAAVSLAIQSKGTGAIDLAAGSSGVNISNGGTVTAITKTALGTNYTSPPALAISAPTTAGGVTATATTTLQLGSVTGIVISGGSGYAVGDDFYLAGGTFTTQMRLRVATLSGSAVATVTSVNGGEYTVIPSTPASTTTITGTGSGCTVTPIWALGNTITITNAGSGYVEQPTVTFSGGGGSGAAAYATVGSVPKIQTLGSALSFYTPSGEAFRIVDIGATSTTYWGAIGSGSTPYLNAYSGANDAFIQTNGASSIRFRTNYGGTPAEQLRVSHTASAVNYVQVTGAATGAYPIISGQGSDASVGLLFRTKGVPTGPGIRFENASGNVLAAIIASVTTPANYIRLENAVAGSAAAISAQGSDTNIDLTLTPKNTGVTRAGGSALSAENGIIMNATTVNTNATVATGYNAISVGPLTIASGVSVTVNSGQNYVVI